MMDLSAGHATQLGLALLMGVILFVVVYFSSEKKILAILIVMIPFQFISSRYGSLNMVLVYLIGFSLIIKGRLNYLPLFPAVFSIFIVYALSTSQTLRATYSDHVFYMITIGSNFLLFYMVYNYFLRTNEIRFAFNLLVWMNVLVALYGLMQLFIGADKFAFLGISEFAFAANDIKKHRLMGTFGPPGVNAEYFAFQILFLGYLVANELHKRTKLFYFGLILVNFGLMVGTGSRGSFLSLLGGIGLFLWFYRKELGSAAIIRIVTVGSVGFVIMAVLIVKFTHFNVLFDRLADTEIKGGVPDTREYAFNMTLERIPDAVFLGHGPQLKIIDEATRRIPGYIPLPGFPHNLYLFLLYTVGAFGLVVYLVFFSQLIRNFLGVPVNHVVDPLEKGIPKLAILLLIVFLVDQLKIEFLRSQINDMQHYLFTLWAMLLAFTKNIQNARYKENDLGSDKKTIKKEQEWSVRLRQ